MLESRIICLEEAVPWPADRLQKEGGGDVKAFLGRGTALSGAIQHPANMHNGCAWCEFESPSLTE